MHLYVGILCPDPRELASLVPIHPGARLRLCLTYDPPSMSRPPPAPPPAILPGAADIQAPGAEGRGSLTKLLGGACECALDYFAVGVVPSTHAALVLLLAGADHSVTTHLLQGDGVQCVLKRAPRLSPQPDLCPRGPATCPRGSSGPRLP